MNKNKINYKLVNALILTLIFTIILVTSKHWINLIKSIFNVLAPFGVAFFIAYSLTPFVRKLESKNINKKLAVSIVVISTLLIITLLVTLTAPLLYNQTINFISGIIEGIENFSKNFDFTFAGVTIRIEDTLNRIILNLGEYIPKEGFNILNNSLNFLIQTLIVIILSIYFLIDMEKIRYTVKKIYLKRNKKVFQVIKEIDIRMSKYISGLFLLMLITVIEYLIIYKLINHPNWVILGLLMMLAPIIPYLGGIMVNVVGIITAYATSKHVFIATLIVVFLSSTLDGYIIGPKVHGKSSNIHPMVSILAIVISSALFKVVGIIIAIPLYIVVTSIYNAYEKEIKSKIDDIKIN